MGSGDKKAQTCHTPCLVNSFPARLEASDHSVHTSIAVQLKARVTRDIGHVLTISFWN